MRPLSLCLCCAVWRTCVIDMQVGFHHLFVLQMHSKLLVPVPLDCMYCQVQTSSHCLVSLPVVVTMYARTPDHSFRLRPFSEINATRQLVSKTSYRSLLSFVVNVQGEAHPSLVRELQMMPFNQDNIDYTVKTCAGTFQVSINSRQLIPFKVLKLVVLFVWVWEDLWRILSDWHRNSENKVTVPYVHIGFMKFLFFHKWLFRAVWKKNSTKIRQVKWHVLEQLERLTCSQVAGLSRGRTSLVTLSKEFVSISLSTGRFQEQTLACEDFSLGWCHNLI